MNFFPTTPDEITRANAEGARRGCAVCPRCGDSALWKPFHRVQYQAGRMELVHKDAKPDDPKFSFNGVKAVALACEDCWGRMSLPERLTLVDALLNVRAAAVPSVICVSGPQGEVREIPKDRKRWELAIAAIAATRDALLAAVTAEAANAS